MSGFVYQWTNKINGKKYIGSHVGSIDDAYVGSGTVFKNAIKKHGIDNFERTILFESNSQSEIREKEQYYLDLHDVVNNKNFYNVSPHSCGGWDVINKSDKRLEYNKRISEAAKLRHTGGNHPKGFLGKQHSKETREHLSRNVNRKYVTVHKFSLNGDYIESYDSLTAAARSINGSPSNIKYMCEGRFKHIGGYVWSYTK